MRKLILPVSVVVLLVVSFLFIKAILAYLLIGVCGWGVIKAMSSSMDFKNKIIISTVLLAIALFILCFPTFIKWVLILVAIGMLGYALRRYLKHGLKI